MDSKLKNQIFILLICCLNCSLVVGDTDIWKQIIPSSVLVTTYDHDGTKYSYATGICVAKGKADFGQFYVFLTARHVVQRKSVDKIFSILGPVLPPRVRSVKSINRDDSGRTTMMTEVRDDEAFFHVIVDDEMDFAILFVVTQVDLRLIPCELLPEKETESVSVGQTVYTVGAPGIYYLLFKQGMISGVSSDRLYLDSGTYFGASGGGIFNKDAKLIGMTIEMVNETTGIALSIDGIYDFFRRHKVFVPEMKDFQSHDN